ncbi:MAG: YcjX family protein, partial [Planctomycetes bacterium]|nr:YcjX family protein [Planctomycetota bacterium]
MKKVRLAVTGLRQSGKTVFLTSLIGYLLGGGTKHSELFRRHGVTISAKKLPVAGIEGRFSVEKYMNDFRYEPPKWPERTQELSEFHLLLQMRNQRRAKEVKLELVDYPGERIIDLPMGGKSFEVWSDETAVEATVGVRAELSRDWREKCDGL